MEIMEIARELGVALAESKEYANMTSAQSAVMANQSLTSLASELAEMKQSLVALIQGESFSADEAMSISADIERLQTQLMENPLFAKMSEAQKTFAGLLKSVDVEINACIGTTTLSDNGCSGNCAACGGCAH